MLRQGIRLNEARLGKNGGIDRSKLKLRYIFIAVFFFRLFNAISIKTFFQPDEYYQVLEPAHKFAFGYGYITWEWDEKLRSSLVPIIYGFGYKLADFLFNGSTYFIVLTPKVIGALIAAIGEVAFFDFVRIYTGNDYQVAFIALILSLLNPFNWYIYTRSFSNCMELVLTICAFRYWPWNNKISPKFLASLAFAIISCIVRPTNIMIWLILGINLFFQTKSKLKLIVVGLIELMCILLLNLIIDYWFYQEITFPLYNFFEFNYIRNLSVFYGVAPWHFYIFQAIPLMLLTYLPWFSISLVKSHFDILNFTGLFVLFVFSLIGHKEFRFVYPLMPIMLMKTARTIQKENKTKYFKAICVGIAAINIFVAYFLSRVNERGALDVIEYLRTEPTVESFGFLTPCHSTPWQSHLHNLKFESSWALTCEPPLHLTSADTISEYKDESDIFFDNEVKFLNDNFPSFNEPNIHKKYSWPSHLIIFQPQESILDEYLRHSPYKKCKRFFNSYFHWDSRRNGDLIVYCKNTNELI